MPGTMFGELHLRELPAAHRRARVCLLYTGGTIGMTPHDAASPSRPLLKSASFDEILEVLLDAPGLGEGKGIELGYRSFREPMDSSDIRPEHWVSIAAAIAEDYDRFDGFVVLHGTDTMAYTSSALSFLLRNLGKPVVVTGSLLPMKEARGDARANLASSILIAGYPASGLPRIPEVVLVFMDRILRGNRAVKISSDRWLGFDSPNFPWLGTIGKNISIRTDLLQPPPPRGGRFRVDRRLARLVKIIHVNPGLTPEQLEADMESLSPEGVILLTYGAGNIGTRPEFGEVLSRAVARGVHVANVTQCLQGSVELGLYQASSALLESGVASGLDLTLEAALTKSYWVLANVPRSARRDEFLSCQQGEQSYSLVDVEMPVSDLPEEGVAEIESSCRLTRHVPLERLSQATIRIRGLTFEVGDGDGEPCARIFLNGSGTPGAAEDDPGYCGRILPVHLSEQGAFMLDVTDVFRHTWAPGPPVALSLIAENARIRCESIELSVFAETQ